MDVQPLDHLRMQHTSHKLVDDLYARIIEEDEAKSEKLVFDTQSHRNSRRTLSTTTVLDTSTKAVSLVFWSMKWSL